MANPKFSKAGKMPSRSWSLIAKDTCPGAFDSDTGEIVDACKGCYAINGNYRFSNVKNPRLHNREDWKDDDWVETMVTEMDNDRYFRWFDSGDVYHPKLAEKIYQVMKQTPWVRHWLPTRSHKIPKIKVWLNKMETLPNVVVRYSSDSVRGDTIKGTNTSTIIGEDQLKKFNNVYEICQAYYNDGKCNTCRKCWDRNVVVVAYVQHGLVMRGVNKKVIARG